MDSYEKIVEQYYPIFFKGKLINTICLKIWGYFQFVL